jgi:hypothetical protein
VLGVPPGAGGGKGKGRMALLSVAAVAVVLGGTVAGVKFMSSSGPEKCAEASCAAVQTTTSPSPTESVPDTEEPAEDEPTDEPAEEETTAPSDAPAPTTTYGNRAPRRSQTPTPKPTRTKTKATAQPTQDDDPPADDLSTEEPTEDPTSLDNSDTGVVPTVGSSAAPSSTAQSAPSGGSVNVRQTVKQQRMASYKATLHVTNQSRDPLENATFSVTVEGRVMDVNGASWTQDGDLLIVDLSGSLAAGESVDVTYSATGKAEEPGTCGLVGGECSVA